MKAERDNAGELFQRLTKYTRDELPKGGPDWDKAPERYKVYDKPIAVISLPPPDNTGGDGLWDVLARRRTRRTYKPEPLSLAKLSQLLWAADGKTKEGREAVLRTAPSAGALYPVELYVMANSVEGLERGIYHYDVPGHALAMIREGDYSEEAASAALGQAMMKKSGAVVFLTAMIGRCRWKYRQRAYRYIYLDAGHIGQDVCLAGEAMGLGVCPIGAFYDDELSAVLGVDGEQEPVLYAFTVGRQGP